MSESEKIDRKPPSLRWKNLIFTILAIAILYNLYRYIFNQSSSCFSSIFSIVSLYFSFFAIIFSFLFIQASFHAETIQLVAKVYPDEGALGEWHAKQSYRLGALSNLGYALILMACGWVWPTRTEGIWNYFGPLFVAGVIIVAACKIILWIRHGVFRPTMIKSYALSSIFFIFMVVALLSAWAYWQFYFDFVVFILFYIASVALAGLVVGQADLNRYNRSNSAANPDSLS